MIGQRKSLWGVLAAGAAATALGAGGAAQAAGFYLEDQSARATGRAFSGEAADTGAASLFYNPAAIAGIDRSEIDGNITPIFVDARINDTGSTIKYVGQPTTGVGGVPNAFKPIELGVIPSSASVLRINDQWSVGVAITSPFSFATKYDDADVFSRYAALTTRLTTIDFQPTIAWRPVRWLGIGAGPVVEYTDALLSNALPQLAPGGDDGRVTLRGNGWDVGYAVGVQLHPTERLTLGGAYRSKIDHTLNGDAKIADLASPLSIANGDTPAAAKFTTPWTATFSVRWKVTDRLTLEGQGVRFGWSDFQQIELIDPTSVAPLPNQAENYKDTTNGALGFDYVVTPRFTVRAGVQYDPTPTPNVGRDPRVPDGDRWTFGAGYTLKVTDHITFDGAASYVDFIPSHINHDASAYGNILGGIVEVPISIQGEVRANAETLSVGAHYYF